MSMGMFTSKSLNAYCQLFHRNFAPIYIPSTLHKGTLKTLFGFCLKKKKAACLRQCGAIVELYEEV